MNTEGGQQVFDLLPTFVHERCTLRPIADRVKSDVDVLLRQLRR